MPTLQQMVTQSLGAQGPGGDAVTGQEGLPIFNQAVSQGATLTDLSSLARNSGRNIGVDEISQYLTSQGLDPTQLVTPNYGLGGAEKALGAAGETAIGYLDEAFSGAEGRFSQGVDALMTGQTDALGNLRQGRQRINQIINQVGLRRLWGPLGKQQ